MVSALFLFAASSARAATYALTVTQSSSGTITATLDVVVGGACDDALGQVFNVSRSGNRITVEAAIIIHSPGCTPPSTGHYQLTASLGTLPDGDYTLSWGGPGGSPVVATTGFQVVARQLVFMPNPVPTLGTPMLALTAATILLFGLARIARR